MSRATNVGFGRLLIVIYAIFAVAATARSLLQLFTKFDQAPVAYSLSAVAALVYVVATIALARGTSYRVALVAIVFELVGVIAVGTWSLVDPGTFPDASVWSEFGRGYLFIPLVLPFVGLWWLWRVHRQDRSSGQ